MTTEGFGQDLSLITLVYGSVMIQFKTAAFYNYSIPKEQCFSSICPIFYT